MEIDREFSSLIPPLSDDELATLKTSIEEEGVREPLIVWATHDIILDGHNRYRIATELDISYKVVEMAFNTREEAMVWMIDNQRGRRNLTKQAWLDLGFKRAELLKPRAEANLHRSPGRKGSQESDKDLPPVEPVDTLQEAANYAGVSRDTAAKYKRVMTDAPEEIKEEVRTGKKSINKAYQEIHKPKHEEVETEEVEIIIEDEEEEPTTAPICHDVISRVQNDLERDEESEKKQGEKIALSLIEYIENELKYTRPRIKSIIFDSICQWIKEND